MSVSLAIVGHSPRFHSNILNAVSEAVLNILARQVEIVSITCPPPPTQSLRRDPARTAISVSMYAPAPPVAKLRHGNHGTRLSTVVTVK